VQSGTYVGLHNVGKVKCHHLAFRQRMLDWQIWIEAGDQPLEILSSLVFQEERNQAASCNSPSTNTLPCSS
jgi:hypothetical protein